MLFLLLVCIIPDMFTLYLLYPLMRAWKKCWPPFISMSNETDGPCPILMNLFLSRAEICISIGYSRVCSCLRLLFLSSSLGGG